MKNGRRQRKKSFSSAESGTAENAEASVKGSLSSHGKEKAGRTDAHVPVVHGDASSTSKEQISSSGDRVRQWFSGLCWEERAAVSCIEDAAFLATLVDLASSSSGSHDPLTTGASRGESVIQVNWGASFSIEDIEQAYNSNGLLRFAEDKTTSSMLTTTSDIEWMLPISSKLKGEAMNSIPSLNIAENKSDAVNVKGTDGGAEDKCIPQPIIESDAFRIQRGVASQLINAKQATQPASRSATSDASDAFVQTSEISPLPDVEEKSDFSEKGVVSEKISSTGQQASGILDHVRIVFPSVYNTFLTHISFEGDRDHLTEAVQNPIITLDPDVLRQSTGHETLFKFDMLQIEAGVSDTDDMFLSDERYQYWQQSSEAEAKADSLWIRLLRQLVEKSKNISETESKKRSTLSLALLLVIGMEASIMTAYSGVYGTRTVTSGVATKGVVKGIGMKIARIQFTVIAEAVERLASAKSSAGMMRIMRPVSYLLPGEILNAQWVANLGLLQLCWLLRSNDDLAHKSSSVHLISWNNALGMSMKALLDDSKVKDCSQIDEKREVQELAAARLGSCDDHVVLEGSTTQASTKKCKQKNKRKNKNKRKVSNADQSLDSTDSHSYVRTTAVDERVGELRSSNEERPSTVVVKPADAAAVELSKSPQETSAEGKQLICSLPNAEHVIIPKHGEINLSDTGQHLRKLYDGCENGKEAVTMLVSKVESATRSLDSCGQDAAPADKSGDSTTDMDDHSAWEIVETKSRGNRNKKVASGQVGSGKFASHYPLNATSCTATGGASATKKSKRMQTSRRRNHTHNHTPNPNRKMVRDILASVLDGVDAEVKRRRVLAVKSMADGTRRLSDCNKQINHAYRQERKYNSPSQTQAWQAKPMTMRDVVLGRLRAEADKVVDDSKTMKRPALLHVKAMTGSADVLGSAKAKAGPIGSSGNAKAKTGLDGSGSVETKTGMADGSDSVGVGHSVKKATPPEDEAKAPTPSLRHYPNVAWADQSTAPTVPETLSGVSANTQSSAYTDGDNRSETYNRSAEKAVEQTSSGDPIFGDAATFAPRRQHTKTKGEKKETSQIPPLPALLGPGNTNSASSSVASSLEAPHTRHIHHHFSTANENDVGYHLLDVCDRLSHDMDVFMGRRALALGIRRRERGALLAALQDTASKLWTGRCHVEMYGSCATQLDLPSSDLDAVICGLDRNPDGLFNSASSSQKTSEKNSIRRRSSSQSDVSVDASHYVSLHESLSDMDSPFSPVSPYILAPPLSPNAERVIRLAAELERQPWAVQVKAIPTASVPVVKILADPSRLPGAVAPVVSGDDWMMQQHHMAAHAAGVGVKHPPPQSGYQPLHHGAYFASSNASALALGAQSHFVPHSPPPWRGADIMNGLFQVDITFEGPEHGGIGSTVFSARVVQDACDETGLPPDRTPVVQAAMVLKELLAQRRLNEPFSGGLSSYALLLLVVAVLKERGAIRQEMERIERQRLAVVAGDPNATARDQQTGIPSHETQRHGAPGTKKGRNIVATSRARPNEPVQNVAQKSLQPVAPTRSSGVQKLSRQNDVQTNRSQEKASLPEAASKTTITRQASSDGSSWASIAKKNTAAGVAGKTPAPSIPITISQPEGIKGCRPPSGAKVSTFADAVSKHAKAGENLHTGSKHRSAVVGKTPVPQQPDKPSVPPQSPEVLKGVTSGGRISNGPANKKADSGKKAVPSFLASTETSSASDSKSEASFGVPSLFPQGSNDVLEVLCSGETTAGKLLMHFLLFYGRHFDSHSTVVDVSGKHHPDFLVEKRGQHVHLSPFVTRTTGGSIDPVTGMLTVDPIIVYDPLEGAEDSNVARSCFAWSSIRWVFGQSYMTLSSAVERSGTPPATGDAESGNRDVSSSARVNGRGKEDEDMVSPLLELLLSF